MEMYLPSNCYRDAELVPKAIVIHYFSAINVEPKDPYNLVSNWSLMCDLNLPKDKRDHYLKDDRDKRYYASAHCFICREGRVVLTVPEDRQAYHAGKSEYMGFRNWNTFSYGIELIGSATSGFTDAQYIQCAKHCARLMREYKIGLDWVVGHEEIAPGRKKDPGIATGNFDMIRLKRLIKGQYQLLASKN